MDTFGTDCTGSSILLIAQNIFPFIFHHRLQMSFRSLLWIVLVLFLAYSLYKVSVLFMKKYYTTGATGLLDNFRGNSIPAPSILKENISLPPTESVGLATPAGPNPPNVAAPLNKPVEILPEERANDPMDQVNSTVPLKENVRHPERMFNAGGEHSGTHRAVEAGVAGETTGAPAPVGKFSPDFAQNGGEFMTGIFANDLTKGGGNYSEI